MPRSSPAQKFQSIVLGGGCFWCLDAIYRQIKGVERVVSGYAGGTTANPTYEAVCAGGTGHAEVVQVTFDPKIISFEQILEVFWAIHNPTTLNRQDYDVGTAYRSIILYADDDQKQAVQRSLDKVAKPVWGEAITTEIVPLQKFYPAEDYHQDFFNKFPSQSYCQVIINPKLAKLRAKFERLVKPSI